MSSDEWKTTERYIKLLEAIRVSHGRLLAAAKEILPLQIQMNAPAWLELKAAISAAESAEEHARQ